MARNDLRGFVGRGKELASRLTPMQKIGLGAVVVSLVAGALLLGRTSGSSSMSPLYTDLQASDASSVVDALAARNVEYSLTDAGHTVLVPTSQVYDLRVSLAGAGLPNSSQGYSLLDKQGITASDFRQRIDYQRALEGELSRTLRAMQGIQSASVHLALPEESVFVDTPTNPTASVLLVASSIGGINPDAVEAVVHLVASSVKNMKPSDVTVIDSNGTVLSAGGVDGGVVSGSTGRSKAVSAFEQRMSAALTTLLSRTTGVGNVAVTVTADLDLDQVQSTSEDYGPIGTDTGPNVISEQTANETYGSGSAPGNTTAASSVPGVLGNPAVVSSTTLVPSSTTPGYGSTTANRSYAIDRQIVQTTTAPGAIRQLHVAVLLDEGTVTADQATAIQDLVTTAAGIDPSRGDSVMVSRLPFDTSAQAEAQQLVQADSAARKQAQTTQLIRTLAIVVVVIVALFLAYRSARRARRLTATPINIGEISMSRRAGVMTAELPTTANENLLAGLVDRNEGTVGEIANIADRRPEDVANVLRSWLAESQARRP